MAAQTFYMRVGTLDVTELIGAGGFKWERNDIDAPNSGRDLKGRMRRKVIARKDKISVTCRRITRSELAQLSAALRPETVSVRYYCPGDDALRTADFYSSKVNAGIVVDNGNGSVLLDGISFDLVEV